MKPDFCFNDNTTWADIDKAWWSTFTYLFIKFGFLIPNTGIPLYSIYTHWGSKQGQQLMGVTGKGQMLNCKCRAGMSENKHGCVVCVHLVMTDINCNGVDLGGVALH